MKYPVKSSNPPNLCLQCNEPCRRPSRFCNDEEKLQWLDSHKPWHPDWRGAIQVENDRRGVTAESIEWRRKRNVQSSF